jgi:hypothetical protein
MKSLKKPDVKAPRYRKSIQGTLNGEFVDMLKENVPGSRVLDINDIKNIIKAFNGNLWNAVIENRDGVEIPHQLGHLFIGTCKKSLNKNIDFKKSGEYGQVVSHQNWESDQHLAKIFFTTHALKYKFKNHELWSFQPTRNFKRAVSKAYPLNWKKYVQIDPKVKISTMFRKEPVVYNEKVEDFDIDSYNEFEF